MPLGKIDDPISVGLEQLTTAIDLFIQGVSYVSAITLAVAAENIFRRALKERGQTDCAGNFQFFDEIGRTSPHADEKERFENFRSLKLAERDFANHGPDNRSRSHAVLRPLKEVAEEAWLSVLRNSSYRSHTR